MQFCEVIYDLFRQQRKDGLGNSMIMKNSSLTGKGKWKM